jgi:sugar (pentulose or hexulose) kinase
MLLMPSFLSYLFTGTLSCERTMSSITCMTDPTGLSWSGKIIGKFGLQRQIFPKLVDTGSLNGYTRDSLSREIGGKIKVINTAGHDTAAALSILPDLGPRDCFISIGTTIVVGAISESPVMAQAVFEHGYRNSAGPFGRNLLRINISGFWIVNEILKQLKSENREMTFAELEKAAAGITDNRSFFDPKRKVFNVQNANMMAAIRAYCRDAGQVVPEDIGSLMRCVLESFAMRIRYSLDGLKKIVGIRRFDRVFVINGGVRNSLLMQIISDALDHDILVGIPWASLGGNLVIQMCAAGMIDKKDLADVCRNSFELHRVQAKDAGKWHQKYTELAASEFFV